jgi:hypothetical protein
MKRLFDIIGLGLLVLFFLPLLGYCGDFLWLDSTGR